MSNNEDDDEIECTDCDHTAPERYLSASGRCYVCESRHRKRQQADAATETSSDGGAVEADGDGESDDKANTTVEMSEAAKEVSDS